MLPLMLVFCRAIESAAVGDIWTDSRHRDWFKYGGNVAVKGPHTLNGLCSTFCPLATLIAPT